MQLNKANYIHLNARISLKKKLSCIPLVNTVHHGGQIESLWEQNYGRRGLELSMDPSIQTGWCHSVAAGFPLGKGSKFLMGKKKIPIRTTESTKYSSFHEIQSEKSFWSVLKDVPVTVKSVFLFSWHSKWILIQVRGLWYGWDRLKLCILKVEKLHQKCISAPISLLSTRNLNPEIRLYLEKSHPCCSLYSQSFY